MPLLVVPKKDGSPRLVIDYRALNEVTKKDSFPMPKIQEILESLAGAAFFSSFDLLAGFYNIEVEEASKEKTAFISFKGLYEFNRMPMGMSNSPGAMQRLADLLVARHGNFARAYFDDILIVSHSYNEHLLHLDRAFQVMSNLGIKLKASKAQIGMTKVNFLGHTVSQAGMRIDESKVDAIKGLKPPATKADAQSLMGFLGYYRRFLKDFARIGRPIVSQFGGEEDNFKWNPECQKAFETLRDGLLGGPLLHYPDLNQRFIVETDASYEGLGAVLSQKVDGVLRPIDFASRSLSKDEQVWSPTDIECAAVIYAVRQFRCYLYGTEFDIVTDHRPLSVLQSGRASNPRLHRWSCELQGYRFRSFIGQKTKIFQNGGTWQKS